jgi:hypothetical protein
MDPELLWIMWKKEKSLPLLGIEPQFLIHTACTTMMMMKTTKTTTKTVR